MPAVIRAICLTWALFFFGLTTVGRSVAQEPGPEIVPRKNRPQGNQKDQKGKKIKEPRAVAILQLNAANKATLIPVAILVDGKFYDAGAYKADPVPMALESGTVYEAESAGDSEGLFTVGGALHSANPGSEHRWTATGSFLPKGSEPAKTSHKAENVPVGMNDLGDEPPKLSRKSTASADAGSASTPSGAATPIKPGDAKAGDAKPNEDKHGDDKPGDKVPEKSTAPASAEKPADAVPSAKSGAPAPGANPSGDKKSADQKSADQTSGDTKTAASEDSSPNYYGPKLRRGKPTDPAPPDNEDVAKAGAGNASGTVMGTAVTSSVAPSSAASPSVAPAAGGTVHAEAAISDASGPDPQSFQFFWKTGEEDERRKQMLTLAESEVNAYVATLAKNHISAAPVKPKAAGARKVSAKAVKPILENVQFRAYNPWLTDQPVMILSADARIPGWTAAASTPENYSVVLVARTDIYGDLKKIQASITDKFHLDVNPRLELIDVVDADGDGRGEFLFRQTSDAGSGYVIYRPTADKLWPLFDSLHAE